MKNILFLMMVLTFSVAVIAEDVDPMKEIDFIKQVQNMTRSASWEPGITSVSYFTSAERTQLCGLYPVLGYQAVNPTEEPMQVLGYKDLRQNGIITSVKNQGRCGSCWAFAMVACVEAVLGNNPDLSEQHLVSCCTSSSGCNGGYIGSTAQWMISNGGIVNESAYPYTSGSTGQTGTCQSKSGQKFNIRSYSSCSSNSSVKSAIDRGIPVDTGMQVYDDFMHYKSGIYRYTSGTYKGGHAVAIVGYNDNESCWIIKNSWGTGWGEQGYVRMGYDECNVPWMAAYVTK